MPGQRTRLLRTGRLARALVNRGHRVTWWTSTFDHFAKARLPVRDVERPCEGLELHFLDGVAYHRNVSLRRLINHWQLARVFRRRVPGVEPPDVILCSFPTVELCRQATLYARRENVPIAIDVRDLWPDIFVSAIPRPLRWAGRIGLMPWLRQARFALSHCDGILGISPAYLDWALGHAGRPRNTFDAVIPLGYELPRPDPAQRKAALGSLIARGVKPDHATVWFLGTFGRSIDLRPVLAAAQSFESMGQRDVQFVLSGGGERESQWRAAAGGLPNVVFTGWLDQDEVAAMMDVADVGLGAYAADAPQGLPNKFFEYLAAGLPIVASLQGEGREFLARHECGTTYAAGDGPGLNAALLHLLTHPDECARLAANAARVFKERYDAELTDRALTDFLVQLARKPTRGAPRAVST